MSYFDTRSLRFLRDLARNNERPWFHANKARYDAHVRDPYLRLINDLSPALAAISPHLRADARAVGGSLYRIQRDTRFANDKTPYKTWAGARFFHARGKKIDAPLFYLQLAPGNSLIAAGLWHPEPDSLRRVRAFLLDNPAAWTAAVHAPAIRRRYESGGEILTRAPRGFDPAHPLIEDLKRKDFVLMRRLDDETMLSPRLRSIVEGDFERLAPLVDYLCAALDLEF